MFYLGLLPGDCQVASGSAEAIASGILSSFLINKVTPAVVAIQDAGKLSRNRKTLKGPKIETRNVYLTSWQVAYSGVFFIIIACLRVARISLKRWWY